MDLIKSGSYIDIFYAKICATTKISTVAGYHVVLATLLFSCKYGKDLKSNSRIDSQSLFSPGATARFIHHLYMSLVTRKPVFEVFNQVRLKLACSASVAS